MKKKKPHMHIHRVIENNIDVSHLTGTTRRGTPTHTGTTTL